MRQFLTIKDIVYILVILTLAGWLWVRPAHAQVRIEGGIGKCQHSLAQDGSWHYEQGGFENHNQIRPSCYQFGASWMPVHRLGVNFGARFSVVDFGWVRATGNTFPINESAYFVSSATGTPLTNDGGQGVISGQGHSWGLTLGPVIEKQWRSVTFGAEAGLAYIDSTWTANASASQSPDGIAGPGFTEWHSADGWRWTNYVGAQIRYKFAYVSVRRYADVGAWQSCEGCWGLTLGPLVQASIGISYPL